MYNYLVDEVTLWQKMGVPALMQAMVVKHGIGGTPIEHKYRKGTPKQCFANATHLALDHKELTYVEGYATRPSLGLSIHHAWCIDQQGKVIDNTWEDNIHCLYYGIKFTRARLRGETLRNEFYGLLDTPTGINIKLLKKIDPKLVKECLDIHYAKRTQQTSAA